MPTYPPIDAKTVIYAVGDIHGRADLLQHVHGLIERDWQERPAARRLEVYLGDYVDRGPDSASVVSTLRKRSGKCRIMALRGNHEAVLLRFLEGRIPDREWLEWGGAATALSYGVSPSREAIVSAALSRAIPLEDMEFLRGLRASYRYGPYFFAHAGVLPNRPLEEQVAEDLLWIRKPFLEHTASFGAIVVHGHTPNAEPQLRPNRINLDTGAYATHRLTCLRVDSSGAAVIGTDTQ
ncbi:MAG: metallophosphoesterase family protein [Hyphomicrobiales bacterium]|nr:metallophosphoesterase family protein [Hyphomicrobiales bacterium]